MSNEKDMLPSDATLRIAEAQYAQPLAAYSAKMLFNEVADVQMALVEDTLGRIVMLGVVLIIILGFVVWNNLFKQKTRFFVTLSCVIIVTLGIALLRENSRHAFEKVKNAGNRMVDGFAQLNIVGNITHAFDLNKKNRQNDLLQERTQNQMSIANSMKSMLGLPR